MKYLGTKSNDSSLVDKKYVDEKLVGASNKEAFLEWGGRNIVNGVSPIDTAMLKEQSANRLAGFGGVNFYASTSMVIANMPLPKNEDNVHRLLTGVQSFPFTSSNELHVVLNFIKEKDGLPYLYCEAKKLLINFCSNGATECKVTIYKRSTSDWYGGNTNYSETVGVFDIDGNSGWNSIPLDLTIGCWGGQQPTSSHIESLYLKFSAKGATAEIRGLRLIAPTLYYADNKIAETEHPYTYSQSGDMRVNSSITTHVLNFYNGISLHPTSGGLSVFKNNSPLFDLSSGGMVDTSEVCNPNIEVMNGMLRVINAPDGLVPVIYRRIKAHYLNHGASVHKKGWVRNYYSFAELDDDGYVRFRRDKYASLSYFANDWVTTGVRKGVDVVNWGARSIDLVKRGNRRSVNLEFGLAFFEPTVDGYGYRIWDAKTPILKFKIRYSYGKEFANDWGFAFVK